MTNASGTKPHGSSLNENGGVRSGIRGDELDPSVRVQDDLFRHVNGKWIATTPIPDDKARYGSFYILAEEAEKAVREIVEGAREAAHRAESSDTVNSLAPSGGEPQSVGESQSPGEPQPIADPESVANHEDLRKIGDLYASFMDTERIEALGVTPLLSSFALIDNVHSIPQMLRLTAQFERIGIGGFYHAFVDNDPGNPERYLVFLEQGGIGLPDESYYREESFAAIRRAYASHIQHMFELAGVAEAERRAEAVFELETLLAKHHWDKVKSRDAEKTYNLYRWDDLDTLAGGVSLSEWKDALHAPAGSFREVVLRQPGFTVGLAELLTEHHLGQWRDWLRWQLVRSRAPYLGSDFVQANFDFYGHTLSGTPQLRERWKRGVSLVEGALGEAVGREYVARHFPQESKTQMDALVATLIEAYRQSIQKLDWMSVETRQRALEKLAKFTPKIAYPVKWRDYSRLVIDPHDLIANVRAVAGFEFHRELGKVGKAIDRDEWFMTPQTINAYYNPGFNEIVFPAAILQFPFFEPDRDPAANYGAIGAVIGHEIGHGFDDQGSKFDGDGALRDWWTDADRAAFEARTTALIEQYNALSPDGADGQHVTGALTIGENIGDLGGLGIAWKAYLLSLGGIEPPVIDGLTGAQRFFLSWAQAWRYVSRPEETIRLLTIDPHSPAEFRCNQVVRNIDAYYDAFDVTSGDAEYLDPAARVSIW